MIYSKVFIDSIGFELPPVVVSSLDIEKQLEPVYKKLHLQLGQLEALTGISERRWWEIDYPIHLGASSAARKTLEKSNVKPFDLDVLIFGGVCRESFEPATACHIAYDLGISGDVSIYDISNACLGVLNGIIDIANRIELGQIKSGMVVSCESARSINNTMIMRMLEDKSIDLFKTSLATFTGGSGAVAILLTDGSFSNSENHKLVGAVNQAAPEYHNLCRWYVDAGKTPELAQNMRTDSVSVLKYGVALGITTWESFLKKLSWEKENIDKVICHQVGSEHQKTILKTLGLSKEKDYITYPYLGNIGTVSLPLTAALAVERGFLRPGDRVCFMGIGSGLNCLMLGIEW